jgi:hypothetical protein
MDGGMVARCQGKLRVDDSGVYFVIGQQLWSRPMGTTPLTQ